MESERKVRQEPDRQHDATGTSRDTESNRDLPAAVLSLTDSEPLCS